MEVIKSQNFVTIVFSTKDIFGIVERSPVSFWIDCCLFLGSGSGFIGICVAEWCHNHEEEEEEAKCRAVAVHHGVV